MLDEKPILPNDVISISIIEEIIYWLQKRNNKNIDSYIVKSFDDYGKQILPDKAWKFKLFNKSGIELLVISLKSGIKNNILVKNESNLAFKMLKNTYKVENGEILNITNIDNYFN